MTDVIDSFKGETYGFLSNFYPARIWYHDNLYETAEHAYQAMKTNDLGWRVRIRQAKTPGLAKRLGRQAPMRSDWDDVKEQEMLGIVLTKFTTHPELGERLLATGQAQLVEGNTWHDEYWGVDRQTNRGQNRLGVILMTVRTMIRKKEELSERLQTGVPDL